jgi:hypothetical protein
MKIYELIPSINRPCDFFNSFWHNQILEKNNVMMIKKRLKNFTLSFRAAFFCSSSSIALARLASRALISWSLKGQSLGMPGSFSTFFLWLRPSFFASFAFFLWCSFTFFSTLYFFLRGTLLLLLSGFQVQKLAYDLEN